MTANMESCDLIMKVSLTNCECFVQQVRSSGSPLWQFCELHKAAPELLAILKKMHKHFITEAGYIGETEEQLERESMAIIAKAEGK